MERETIECRRLIKARVKRHARFNKTTLDHRRRDGPFTAARSPPLSLYDLRTDGATRPRILLQTYHSLSAARDRVRRKFFFGNIVSSHVNHNVSSHFVRHSLS